MLIDDAGDWNEKNLRFARRERVLLLFKMFIIMVISIRGKKDRVDEIVRLAASVSENYRCVMAV